MVTKLTHNEVKLLTWCFKNRQSHITKADVATVLGYTGHNTLRTFFTTLSRKLINYPNQFGKVSYAQVQTNAEREKVLTFHFEPEEKARIIWAFENWQQREEIYTKEGGE